MPGAFDPQEFVQRHGIVLASAKGPIPNLADAVAGEPIRGSWWSHKKGSEIFRALNVVADSADVLCFKLVLGKNTFVHRRLWPALVRLADDIGKDRLAAIRREHSAAGKQGNKTTPFPKWASREIRAQAKELSKSDAQDLLGSWVS